jgi:hypothetical protein
VTLATSKDTVIRARISAFQAHAAKLAAARAGLTLSDWLRDLVAAALRGPVETATDATDAVQKDR